MNPRLFPLVDGKMHEVVAIHKKVNVATGLLAVLTVILLFTGGCREHIFRENAETELRFSKDTLTFDTVFTQIGSATRRFMVYNPYDEAVRISKVQLREGDQSKFRFNINGYEGDEVEHVEIEARDSLFVFVEVTLDPSDQSLPLIVEDAVQFITNGTLQEVKLNAWGQDAYYFVPTRSERGLPPYTKISDWLDNVSGPVELTLPNDKPYVIFGYLQVDSGMVLNIQPGTEFYFYEGSGFWAYRGSTLRVKGEKGDEVYFRGFRKESFYNTLPGQWDRIILNEGAADHEINYAVIENSFIGISAEYFYLDGSPRIPDHKLKLSNTIIQNTEGIGILSRFYNIEAENCLISNAESRLLGVQGGGKHRYTHCTFGNYWRYGNRQDASVFISNHFEVSNTDHVFELDMEVNNSIMLGSNDEEIEADTSFNDRAPMKVAFQNSVLKGEEFGDDFAHWLIDCIVNPAPTGQPNPVFKNTEHKRDNEEAFYLYPGSAAEDAGSSSILDLPGRDLKGDNRGTPPDAGAYEL